MEQENQGKITIQKGDKTGEELIWGAVLGEKEYQYLGEGREALESMDWEGAEQICGSKLENTFAILFKLLRNDQKQWLEEEQRVLLYFVDKEQESLSQRKDGF